MPADKKSLVQRIISSPRRIPHGNPSSAKAFTLDTAAVLELTKDKPSENDSKKSSTGQKPPSSENGEAGAKTSAPSRMKCMVL
jgi:hypothetical protein